MSVMVMDMCNFSLGIKSYEFCEEGTSIDETTEKGENLIKFIASKVADKEFEKLVFVGPTSYTSEIKNDLSSQLQLNYAKKNLEIELKEKWG